MNPVRINVTPQELSLPTANMPKVTEAPKSQFKDLLANFVGSVNDLQQKAAATEESFLKGEVSDVHEVMIAVEEASVAFELLMEVRNKLLESYQQIMRMPI
ncbi:MAG: flagellar hook-basal body complex protein FliE [bacterium]